MDLTSTISGKGQVTVPVEVRKRLGLKTGDKVQFVIEGERALVRPARHESENPFLAYVGAAKYFHSTEEINAWVRDMRDDVE